MKTTTQRAPARTADVRPLPGLPVASVQPPDRRQLLGELATTLERGADLFRQLAETETADERLDQSNSILGPRRHIECARRLLALRDPRAGRVGSRYYLARSAIHEELARLGLEECGRQEPSKSSLMSQFGLEVVLGGERRAP